MKTDIKSILERNKETKLIELRKDFFRIESQTGFIYEGKFSKNKICQFGYLWFPRTELFDKLKCSNKKVFIELKEPKTLAEVISVEIEKHVKTKKENLRFNREPFLYVEKIQFGRHIANVKETLVKEKKKDKILRRKKNDRLVTT